MNRIAIIGSSGSGKSTLARSLGQKLDIDVIHLDRHYWNPGWVETKPAEWQAKMKGLIAGNRWIIDGNYRDTLDMRLRAADTVIFLDLPRWLCMWRAFKRRLKYANRPRPDIAPGCEEPLFDRHFLDFLRWIWEYPYRARPDVVERLNRRAGNTRIIWLRSPEEVEQFLATPYRFRRIQAQRLPQRRLAQQQI